LEDWTNEYIYVQNISKEYITWTNERHSLQSQIVKWVAIELKSKHFFKKSLKCLIFSFESTE
jgi:hypothetical protein